MTVTKYNVGLNTLSDIVNALSEVVLQQNPETAGSLAKADEMRYWINAAYVLLENYNFRWNVRKATTAERITTTAGTSLYGLPLMCRDKAPILSIKDSASQNDPLTCVSTIEEYQQKISARSTDTATPREFCYVQNDTSTRTYSTGTVSGTSGEYTLTGTGTAWLTNLTCGSVITISATSYTVAKVNTDTSVTLTSALASSPSTSAYSASTTYPRQQIDLNPIPSSVIIYDELYYYSKLLPLIADSDVPLLPLNDRWVLVHGAYDLYQWFHNNDALGMSGMQPSSSAGNTRQFLSNPATKQKFYDLYVAKLLADEKQMSGALRPKITMKRGY
jgi:hypothetical protein